MSASANVTGGTTSPNSTNSTNTTLPTSALYPGVDLQEEAFYEFVIFMIPCFLFILVALKRISSLNSEGFTNSGIQKHISYYIKAGLSLVHMLIYSMQLITASILTPAAYWVCEYRSGALVYLLGIVAWFLSFKLLSREVERGIYQRFYAHRLFWMAHFIIVCFKVSNPIEQKPLPLVLDIAKIIGGFFLTLYALGKPFDSDEADELQGRKNPLPLIRALLLKFENMECTQSLVQERNFGIVSPLLSPRNKSEHELDADAFKGYLGTQNKGLGASQPSDWGKSIPTATCTISKEVIAREEGGKTKVFYEVNTMIKESTYTKLHKFSDFEDLEDYVNKRCDPAKVSWIDKAPPQLEKVQMSDFDDEKAFINGRREVIEKYVNALVSEPKFMNDKVVEFFGILDPYRSAYGRYLQYLVNKDKKKTPTPAAGGNQPLIELGEMNSSRGKKKATEAFIPTLKVRCSHSQKSIYGDHYEYIFVVTDEKDNGNSWSIIKSFGDFKTFHEKLEKAVNKTIPYLNQFIPKPVNQKQTMDPTFIEKRKQGLDSYINMILKQPAYHTSVLYEFLEYDLKRGTHASRGASPRVSAMGHSNE